MTSSSSTGASALLRIPATSESYPLITSHFLMPSYCNQVRPSQHPVLTAIALLTRISPARLPPVSRSTPRRFDWSARASSTSKPLSLFALPKLQTKEFSRAQTDHRFFYPATAPLPTRRGYQGLRDGGRPFFGRNQVPNPRLDATLDLSSSLLFFLRLEGLTVGVAVSPGRMSGGSWPVS